ncbi:MAG: hypothetical protein WCA84_07525 [Ignavibacteriaceae bacterium]
MEPVKKSKGEILKDKISLIQNEFSEYKAQLESAEHECHLTFSQMKYVENILKENCSLEYPTHTKAKEINLGSSVFEHSFNYVPITSLLEFRNLQLQQTSLLNELNVQYKELEMKTNYSRYLVYSRELYLYNLKKDYEYYSFGETAAISYWESVKKDFYDIYQNYFVIIGFLGKYNWAKYFVGDNDEKKIAKDLVDKDMLNVLYGNNFQNLIHERIDITLNKSNIYKWETEQEFNSIIAGLFPEVERRFTDGMLRKFDFTFDDGLFDFNPYDIEATENIIDEIIFKIKPELRPKADESQNGVIIGITKSYIEYLKENKSIFDEFDEPLGLLPKRLKEYIRKLDILLSQKEYDKIFQETIIVLKNRYHDGVKYRIEQSEKDDLSDVNLNISVERLCMEFDELLCLSEPKFKSVVQNNPVKKNQEINVDNTPAIPEDKQLINIPSKGLKKLSKAICEQLIKDNVIQVILKETKLNPNISFLIIQEMKKNYKVSSSNEISISDYFRKFDLQIKKNKNGALIVVDNYKYKKKY